MASQRFCLRWNNHQSNLLSVFDQLLHAETFTDVTLAVEGQYLKAHKMVLSACSPYFNALFVNHPEKHPIVILKDVPYSDMKSLLDFMYRGEVSVDQERLTAFLRVAESLRIKGLTEVNDDKPGGAAPTPPPPQLHRIQPYLVQQRNKAQNMLNINDNQQSLLGTALSSMPKRKRGRPRKLSGSSNGTGNDFDEYDRDGMMHDSPKHEVKMSGDGYSGNEGSDENQRESCDNDQDANDCTDSRDGRTKKSRKSQSKDRINNDNDNSTSDPNDSDCDDQMDASFMEPQLMLDEYDEPVEFKYDPSSSPNSQEATSAESVAHNNQQQQQQALLLAQQKHQQQMAVAAAAAAAVAKGAALIGPGSVPGTVTILNTMGAIPKLTPIVKSKPKLSKRPKLKQNGLSQPDVKPLNNNDFIDMFASNFIPGNTAPGKLKATLTIAANTQMSGTTPGGANNNNSSNLSVKASSGNTGSGNTVSLTKMKGSGGSVGGGGGGDSMGSGNNIHLNNSPELSQRLFGVNKPPPPPTPMAPTSSASSSLLPVTSTAQTIQTTAATHTPTQQVSNSTQIIQISSATAANNQHKQTALGSALTQVPEILDPATHLPTALGLKIRVHPVAQQQQQQQQSNQQQLNSNKSVSSMLQQQLRNDSLSNNNNNNKNINSCQTVEKKSNNQASERRQSSNDSNTIQPPSSNNLHHQFLLHMATNPIVKTEYLINNEINNDENVMPIEVSSSPNSNSNAQNDKSETEGATPTIIDLVPSPTNANEPDAHQQQLEESPPVTPRNPRPVQRRRIRRKAQSSIDDQAEHLTEMSVRGLDLFRYASITEGVYQCTECAKENVQKTFKNKYSFQRHAFLYHEGKHRKVFPCPVCGKEFSRPDKMKNHMKMTHEGFVPKDVGYHPLNYLITAAAAGEIQHLFHQIDQNNPEINSGESTTPVQHPPTQQSLIKMKNEIHTIHEASPSPPPPPHMGSHEANIIAAQEEVK